MKHNPRILQLDEEIKHTLTLFIVYGIIQLSSALLSFKSGQLEFLYFMFMTGIPGMFFLWTWYLVKKQRKEVLLAAQTRAKINQSWVRCPGCGSIDFFVHPHNETNVADSECYIITCKSCDKTGVIVSTFQ